jgi:hypothetical protein
MQPGGALWQKAVKRLFGLHDSQYAATAWFVQAPHITGKHARHAQLSSGMQETLLL